MARDYFVAVDENGQPYLAHAGENGGWKNRATKYLGKFPNLYGNGKTAYAYTQQQLRAMQNYARGGTRSVQNAPNRPTSHNKNVSGSAKEGSVYTRGKGLNSGSGKAKEYNEAVNALGRYKSAQTETKAASSRLKENAKELAVGLAAKSVVAANRDKYDQDIANQVDHTVSELKRDTKASATATARAAVKQAKAGGKFLKETGDFAVTAAKENASNKARETANKVKSKSDRMKDEFRKNKEKVKDKLDDVQDTVKEATGYGAKERLGNNSSNLNRAREEAREARKRQDAADIRARIAQEDAAMYDVYAKSTPFGKKKAQEVADKAQDKYEKAKNALDRAKANSAHAQEVYDNLSKDAEKYDSSLAKKIDDAKSKADKMKDEFRKKKEEVTEKVKDKVGVDEKERAENAKADTKSVKDKLDDIALSSKRSKYSEYKENDPDFDDKNYDEKNRVGDTDFFSFKGKDGRTVIVEEDMKWTLPKGVDPNSPEIHAALKKFASQVESAREMNNSAYTGQEWRDAVTEAIDDASREALKKK